jgi:adenosylmethionine-8-amino-7-oxononanoate aminotransferase
MVMYEPESLDKLMQICKENGVLTIADEVMRLWKTGKIFATDYLVENQT